MEVPNAKGGYRTWKGESRARECYAAFRGKWPDPRHVFAAVAAWSDGLALTKMGRVTGHPAIITSMNLPWALRYKENYRVRARARDVHNGSIAAAFLLVLILFCLCCFPWWPSSEWYRVHR